MDRINNKLSGDATALVLTILSLVITLIGCCCGLFAIGSLILSIIGLVMASRSLREYALEPENYDFKIYKRMNTARLLGIIGIVFSAIVILAHAAFWVFEGEDASKEFWERFQNDGGFNSEWDGGSDSDSIVDDSDKTTITLKKQGDSIVIDSTAEHTQL